MITENLSTLKIHKLTQAQYDRELEAGNIDETALYLTPEEVIPMDSTGRLSGNIITPNGKAYQGEDTNGNAYNLIFLSTSNTLQIGYGLPKEYNVKINNPIIFTSSSYGDSLPSAGIKGRFFFKKVNG